MPSANENQTFTLTRTTDVTYGFGTRTVTKTLPAGTHRCDNATFGDPSVGDIKTCTWTETAEPPAPAPAPTGPRTMPPHVIPAHFIGTEVVLFNLDKMLAPEEIEWLRVRKLRLDYSHGWWTVMHENGKMVTAGMDTPFDAVMRAHTVWANE